MKYVAHVFMLNQIVYVTLTLIKLVFIYINLMVIIFILPVGIALKKDIIKSHSEPWTIQYCYNCLGF